MWYAVSNAELYHHGIKGQRWGVRRYQNEDGTLTEAGKKRYDRDVRENNAKKKDNRMKIDGPDPDRWVKEDLTRTKKLVDSSSNAIKEAQTVERDTRPKPQKQRLDLSKMSDQELRKRINREILEKQYNDMFAKIDPSTVDKGRIAVRDILEIAGTTLGVASSAIGIALAIKELKG